MTSDPITIARFWSKVDVGSPARCWLWRATLNFGGYGQFGYACDGTVKHGMAHRIAYELLIGPIPEGLQLDHLCKTPACCNPAHLDPVVARINVLRSANRAAINAQKTHCVRGHPFDELNTYWRASGRQCRACRTENAARYRARKKAK